MAFIIVEPCIDVKDSACVIVCPVECIYEGPDQYYIQPDECIDCALCVPECPVEAILTRMMFPISGWTTSRKTATSSRTDWRGDPHGVCDCGALH